MNKLFEVKKTTGAWLPARQIDEVDHRRLGHALSGFVFGYLLEVDRHDCVSATAKQMLASS